MPYSIIIPVYNEIRTLETLLKSLKPLWNNGNEIIIVNDGSSDGSNEILKKYNFFNVLHLKKNYGKGIALKVGLNKANNDKVIIYDGDLELEIRDIKKLMILDKSNGIHSIMGIRFSDLSPFRSKFDWGNFIFTFFFNLINRSTHKDILCCAKSFYLNDIPLKILHSSGFDIDVELSSLINKNNRGKQVKQVLLNYHRRTFSEGKKLKIKDGWIILERIILSL